MNEQTETARVEPVVSPFYDRDGITIYNADCRQVLPFLDRFDLLLTDPPYGIGEDGGSQRTRGSKRTNGLKMGWDTERPSPVIFMQMLECTDQQVIWGGNYFADLLPPSRCWLYWNKLMGGDFADGELAWTSRDGVLKHYTHAKQTVARVHPTQKPLPVIKWCLSFFPNAKSVLDPFMGSGTTLVAAKLLGLRAVGIEINREYCEVAVRRLRQGVLGFGSEG